MPRFHYQALNAQQQPVTGEVDAVSVAQAVAQLEASGLSLQSISLATDTPTASQAGSPFAVGPTALQLHMRRVLERGREIVPALRAYAGEIKSGRRRQQLEAVIQVLERGDSAEAAARLDSLPSYWIPLLTAATSSRDPGRVLREFLEESRRAEDFQRQWWLTLAYPLIVVAIALAVLTVFSFLVIPIFREIFTGFGLKLPGFTVMVMSAAEFLTSGRILVALLVLIGLGVVLLQLGRILPLGLRAWFGDRFGLPLGRSTALARFAQFTADLLEAELEPWQALRLSGMATDSRRIRRAAWSLANHLESSGPPLAGRQRAILTATLIHAVQDDLPPKARVRLLRELATSHGQRAAMRLSWTRGIIEPIAICVVGLMVGSVVIALFLPLISLVQGLS